jgi:hypothetical protein
MSTYKVDAVELVKSQYNNIQFPQTVDSEQFMSVIDWLSANGMSRSDALNLFHIGAISVTYLD